jgi:tetratricopeptide (TPR) repeat protein
VTSMNVRSIRQLMIGVAIAASALAFEDSAAELAQAGRSDLFAARYDRAIESYRKALADAPEGDIYYGLTRALLKAHRSKDAYEIAADALAQAGQTPGGLTAGGLAAFRKGEITEAEKNFRAALKLNSNYGPAMNGLASIESAISNVRTARSLLKQAYTASPDDPMLMLAHVNTLKGNEHIDGLERVLGILDPESEEARNLRAHIASDRALAGRKLRELMSPYEPARIKLVPIQAGNRGVRGFGVRVQFNQRGTATLLLDTGASGISLSPKTAEKVGLELLSDQTSTAKGIGDKAPQNNLSFLASEVRIGDVVFGNNPVSAFRSAKDSDVDGLIGTDVFQRFLVSIDFPGRELSLQPRSAPVAEQPEDAGPIPDGFHRVLRSGDHLLIATSVNGSSAKWFLIDSGSSMNLIDSDRAHDFTGVRQDWSTGVRGIQGTVNKVSRANRITLTFAGYRQDNPDLIAISLEKMSDSMGFGITGVLGMPVLSQLKLAIDYHSGVVRFDRPK